MLKACPQQYKLRVLDKHDTPKECQDAGRHIQGSLPHAQAEDFFKLPTNERDLGFFEDTFVKYWTDWVRRHPIDYQKYGAASKKRDLPSAFASWEEYGYFIKQAEALNSVRMMVYLIKLKGLHKLHVLPEEPFKVILEPRTTVGVVEKPGLIIGGRVDLVFDAPANMVDIWDLKAVKDAKRLDLDQLKIYKMGIEARGKKVRDIGYMLLKQGMYSTAQISESDVSNLKRNMRATRQYFDVSMWPARPHRYTCRICDVSGFCQTFKRMNRSFNPDLVLRKPGKVDI